MAQTELQALLEEFTNGQVSLDIVDGLRNELGEEAYYDYKHEANGLTIVVDAKTFEPADKKVMEALVNNVSFNSKEREKAEALLAEFVKREGRYSKIREKEEKEAEKERLKRMKQLEKEEKERQKQAEKEARENQKKLEKEYREELKQLLKELEGADLEQVVLTARQIVEDKKMAENLRVETVVMNTEEYTNESEEQKIATLSES